MGTDDILPSVEELSDDWDILQMAGLQASESQELRRWYLGDLAQKVVRRYGHKSLTKFAGDIKIPRSQTLRDYERVSRFYEFSARAEFPSLTWSHYREALKAREFEDAMDWLTQAADNNWSVVKLGQQIDLKLGKTIHVRHSYDVISVSQGQGRVLVSMSFDECNDFMAHYKEGQGRDSFGLTLAVVWTESGNEQ